MRCDVFLGSEALASGAVTRRGLARRYVRLHRDVYAPTGLTLTPRDRAYAAWLWSGRRAILVAHSAAAILGSQWIPEDAPVEIAHTRRPATDGIVVRSDALADDEIEYLDGFACTTPERTAFDLGRRLPLDTAIIRIDALLNATWAKPAGVEAIAERYPGARGIRSLRAALDLVDGGAESPQETRLRLLLVRAGLPRPVTQIPVGRRRIDVGWPDCLVGVEYDGERHFTNPEDYAADIERLEFLASQRWSIVRVSSRQLRYEEDRIVARVKRARERAGCG
ncbi:MULTISPECIES: hypothetical protein [unclassified Mycobacterium]|uniref:hypothetical protein n=1 Tax=unclassified Mycobacterium TaxID=2642494 RepID=UPI00073FEBA2|nr:MULTISPECIES: hypothetical protein [unclassified Mycobacterium]KUH82343.1 hypothetical protein AU185_21970 [Mycobacterium sp. GA-0227b]KUH88981.1 hypothetical protein AU186_09235 [Mycobacterium sp. GA-1999]